MANRDDLLRALSPVLELVRTLDLQDSATVVTTLRERFPLDGEVLAEVRTLLREGVRDGWLCERENEGIRFSRLKKAVDDDVSIELVHMDKAGPGHVHPNGEVDLCFAVSGTPRFCGHEPGFAVYPPGSWHIPLVEDGAMDIIYFLPKGAIQFGPEPQSEPQ